MTTEQEFSQLESLAIAEQTADSEFQQRQAEVYEEVYELDEG